MANNCRCQSGLSGERSLLRSRYANFEEFEAYDQVFGLAARLGFRSAIDAWEVNPCVESSVNPSDFRLTDQNSVADFIARLATSEPPENPEDIKEELERIHAEAQSFQAEQT